MRHSNSKGYHLNDKRYKLLDDKKKIKLPSIINYEHLTNRTASSLARTQNMLQISRQPSSSLSSLSLSSSLYDDNRNTQKSEKLLIAKTCNQIQRPISFEKNMTNFNQMSHSLTITNDCNGIITESQNNNYLRLPPKRQTNQHYSNFNPTFVNSSIHTVE
ncbi:unnamed protein product, partial [Onchocerca ochengi]